MKWIIDAQLPPSFAAALRAVNCEAVAVREIGLREAKDGTIWEHALSSNAVIVTKDGRLRGSSRAERQGTGDRLVADRQCNQSCVAELVFTLVAAGAGKD